MNELLEPWVPGPDDPLDLKRAGHLLRRAGFCGSLAERQRVLRIGVAAAVAELAGDPAPAGEADLDGLLEDVLALGGIERLRGYRIWRLLESRRPLRERMSLFWHGHFATSNRKVRNERLLGRQLALFDRLGLARFDELCLEVARDPAMVRWLDNDSNRKGHPNENFARELFELFTLGRGHYAESDVQEAARAFTGWHLERERFHFRSGQHDGGEKRVFGKTGSFGGEEIVAMTVRRPESARFLAARWLGCFVHPEPTEAEVAALAQVYERSERDVGQTITTLLRSRLFFSPRAYRSLVKSPVDLVAGSVRALGARAAPQPLGAAAAAMGQAIGEPPSVEGWRGDRAWITSATWLLRANFAADLFGGRRGFELDPNADAVLAPATSAAARADLALELLLDGDVSEAGRRAIHAFAAGPAAAGRGGAGALLHAVMTLPEAQRR